MKSRAAAGNDEVKLIIDVAVVTWVYVDNMSSQVAPVKSDTKYNVNPQQFTCMRESLGIR